jgi:hypothetical protein
MDLRMRQKGDSLQAGNKCRDNAVEEGDVR